VGAHAVLANGGVIAPAGIHMVALAAKRHSVPFVVLVGLHKLSPLFPHDPDVTYNGEARLGSYGSHPYTLQLQHMLPGLACITSQLGGSAGCSQASCCVLGGAGHKGFRQCIRLQQLLGATSYCIAASNGECYHQLPPMTQFQGSFLWLAPNRTCVHTYSHAPACLPADFQSPGALVDFDVLAESFFC
jgi:hypothetical protein